MTEESNILSRKYSAFSFDFPAIDGALKLSGCGKVVSVCIHSCNHSAERSELR